MQTFYFLFPSIGSRSGMLSEVGNGCTTNSGLNSFLDPFSFTVDALIKDSIGPKIRAIGKFYLE